ncbi:MAG TPA: hypothetical protein VF691_10560 [Cytophagaceae bacterium]|jgi:hypothetical protein
MSFQSTSFLSLLFNEGVYIIPEMISVIDIEKPLSKAEKQNALEPVKTAPSTEPIPSIGNNKKRILIITHHLKSSLGGSEKDFLIKILGALKLSLEDVAIINSDNLNFEDLIKTFTPSFMLAFTNANNIGFLNDNKYYFSTVKSIQLLRADELSSIENDKSKKTLLWNALKDVLVGI